MYTIEGLMKSAQLSKLGILFDTIFKKVVVVETKSLHLCSIYCFGPSMFTNLGLCLKVQLEG